MWHFLHSSSRIKLRFTTSNGHFLAMYQTVSNTPILKVRHVFSLHGSRMCLFEITLNLWFSLPLESTQIFVCFHITLLCAKFLNSNKVENRLIQRWNTQSHQIPSPLPTTRNKCRCQVRCQIQKKSLFKVALMWLGCIGARLFNCTNVSGHNQPSSKYTHRDFISQVYSMNLVLYDYEPITRNEIPKSIVLYWFVLKIFA